MDVDVSELVGATGDLDIEISVMRVSALDDLSAGDVSVMNLRIEDVSIGVPGEPGPPGPPGPPAPGRTELEWAFAVASTEWVLDHDLASRFVEVRTYDCTASQEVIGDVEVVSPDRVVIHWASPMTGRARLRG